MTDRAISKTQIIGIQLNDGDWEGGIEELLSRDIITDIDGRYLINISHHEYSGLT